MRLQVFQAYYVRTNKREMELLFRGRNARRLWFTELDAPYGDVFLRPNHIREIHKIDGNRRQF